MLSMMEAEWTDEALAEQGMTEQDIIDFRTWRRTKAHWVMETESLTNDC